MHYSSKPMMRRASVTVAHADTPALQQLQCEDSSCTANCHQNTYPLRICTKDADGDSSMILTCDATGETEIDWSGNDQCSGSGTDGSDTVGKCQVAGTGGSYINTCVTMELGMHYSSKPMMRRASVTVAHAQNSGLQQRMVVV